MDIKNMLRQDLQGALKDAMKTKDARRLSTIRLILAAVKDRDIAMRTEAGVQDDDAVITDILTKMVKQRRESIKMYEEGGRCELAEQEREEIGIIEDFLPRQLSDEEIDKLCRDVIAEVEASGLKDMGKAMGVLKERYQGQMDFAKAGAKMRALLS
jgi:uncharacterized protein YqeY